MKKAMIIFIETDEQIEMKIEFDGEPDGNSLAHTAAAKAYHMMGELMAKAVEGSDEPSE